MTVTAVTPVTRLDDFDYEARIERLRAYVEQLERADQQADTGSLQRAADLAAIYEDKRWVEDMQLMKPFKAQRGRPDVKEDSERRFFYWAERRVMSPTTGTGLKSTTARGLLETEEVRQKLRTPLSGFPEGVGRTTFKPLVKLVKAGRGAEVPEVWKRALKLAEAEGQETPGHALVKQARTEHDKALGIKPPVSKRTVESYQHKVEANFDWLVRHNTPEENRALLRRLAERLKAEHQWARGELAS